MSRRAPRLPRLRRPGRRRRAAPRRRGGRAARRPALAHRGDRHLSTGEVDAAFPPMSVTLRLADDLDVSRGDMIVARRRPADDGARARRDGLLDGRQAAAAGRPLRDQAHDARGPRDRRRARATGSTSTRSSTTPPSELALNEIGRVRLRSSTPLMVDRYRAQPHHRQLHPDRRGDERHRRRRDDPGRPLARQWRSSAGGKLPHP